MCELSFSAADRTATSLAYQSARGIRESPLRTATRVRSPACVPPVGARDYSRSVTTTPAPVATARSAPSNASNASVAVQFVLCGIVWGSSFLFMKVALTGISPGQVVWSRLILGGLTLGLFVALRGDPLPRRVRVWLHMTVLAISFCVVPFLLFSWAQ